MSDNLIDEWDKSQNIEDMSEYPEPLSNLSFNIEELSLEERELIAGQILDFVNHWYLAKNRQWSLIISKVV